MEYIVFCYKCGKISNRHENTDYLNSIYKAHREFYKYHEVSIIVATNGDIGNSESVLRGYVLD